MFVEGWSMAIPAHERAVMQACVYVVYFVDNREHRVTPRTEGTSMTRVAATKLRTAISDLLDRVVHHGERVAVERYGKLVAALVSPEDLELLEAIEDRMDIEAARKALREPGRRSWDEIRAELALQDDRAV